MPSIISKYRKSAIPDFSKFMKEGIDTFLKGNNLDDNACNQSYNPNYEMLQTPLTLGIPNFKRFVSREYKENLEKDKNKPDGYDFDKVNKGYDLLSEYKKPFK